MPMTAARRSYAKTSIVAAVFASLIAITWVALLCLPRLVPFAHVGVPLLAWILWLFACAALLVVLAIAAAITAGGVISLRRDSLEARGLPYADRLPRERVAGLLSRTLRALHLATPGLLPGDWVEVRSLAEILRTLDSSCSLDGLPFMPEMAAFCGRRLRVLRRVEKINDYVNESGLRRMRHAVLLDAVRCGGEGHGGCQAGCHIIWKEAWLKAPDEQSAGPVLANQLDLQACASRQSGNGERIYLCQMTQVAGATTPLSWSDPRHYIRDFVQGNVRSGYFLLGICVGLFNWLQRRRGGACFPSITAPPGTSSPQLILGLQPGQLVRVRSKSEIEATLNRRNRNRGLWFDGEMLRFCGGRYRVARRIERLIDERTGRLLTLTNPTIALEGVTATGEYLAFCPQNEWCFWREIWLQPLP
jgi:hypothetical protein